MIKYYVANTEKTKFAYLTTLPKWCENGGKVKLIYGVKTPHLFSLTRAKQVIAQFNKYNITGYQIFITTII